MKSWLVKLGKSKIKPRTKPDKSKVDLLKSELAIAKAKGRGIDKLAKDVKENIPMFKEGKAFKKGLGKFGFNKPSGKK